MGVVLFRIVRLNFANWKIKNLSFFIVSISNFAQVKLSFLKTMTQAENKIVTALDTIEFLLC